jgi:transcription elongation factor/antiterminator RfaH
MISCRLQKNLIHSPNFQSESLPVVPTSGSHDPESRWFAVWTKSRQEKSVAEKLHTLGIQHYLPLKSELHKWSDRKKIVATPLFNGYLFVNVNVQTNGRLQVLKVPGVGALVGNQAGPLPIPDQQIEDIRKVLTSGVECSVQPSLKKGDRVRVVEGALAGLEGILVHSQATSRVLVSIEMIRQCLSVNVPQSSVELIEDNLSSGVGYGQATAFSDRN